MLGLGLVLDQWSRFCLHCYVCVCVCVRVCVSMCEYMCVCVRYLKKCTVNCQDSARLEASKENRCVCVCIHVIIDNDLTFDQHHHSTRPRPNIPQGSTHFFMCVCARARLRFHGCWGFGLVEC